MPDIYVNIPGDGREFITRALKEAATTMRYKLEETIADLYKKEQIMKPVEKRKLKYIAEGKILPIRIAPKMEADKNFPRAMAESDYRERMQSGYGIYGTTGKRV